MKAIIDRIDDNDMAVLELENSSTAIVPMAIIPVGAKEGSIITINCDKDATEDRRTEIKSKMNSIFHK